MNDNRRSFALFLLLCFGANLSATGSDEIDTRVGLGLTASEKHHLLSEMRHMLASIQGIMTGIGTQDRDLIIRSARDSGNQMARNTPPEMRRKLPMAFKEIGHPTHMMFEELVVRAETDDMSTLAEFSGRLMRQCLSCHEKFKAD